VTYFSNPFVDVSIARQRRLDAKTIRRIFPPAQFEKFAKDISDVSSISAVPKRGEKRFADGRL
jgi:hypothetical protein